MTTFCYEDHRGMSTEEAKRQIVQLNKALTASKIQWPYPE
jgi:hypothetical protein